MKVLVKRTLSLVMVLVMVLLLIPIGDISVKASGKMTLEQLQLKFPHNKYWNHAGNPGSSNSVNNQDGYTSTPCSVHGVVGTSKQTCNGFQPGSTQLSWQCMGYAEKLGYDFTGYNPRNNANGWYTYTSSSALNSLKAGDIVRYKNNGHSIFVTAVNGDTVTYTDCNSDNHCVIKWGKTISKSTLKASFTHVRSAPYSPGNGTDLEKSNKYPTPIKAQTKATGKTTVYNYPNGSAISNKIYDTDLCTIKTIYTNGWCKVSFPLDSGGTETGYVKTSVFFNPSYSIFKVKAGKQITTYPRSNLTSSFGYTVSGDTVYIIGHTTSAVQILYPLSSGGYKAGWVSISSLKCTIKYNSNGGTGSMSNSSVNYQDTLTLSSNKFTKTGHTFNGWHAYRSSDKTWSIKGGWKTASQISSNNYSKYVYKDSASGKFEDSWMSGGKTNDTFTFYAVWRANTLKTYFNANGGTISSDTYKLSNNTVYTKSDNSKYVQTWTYNKKKTNGLVNRSTLGLTKKGHTFKGWGTKASGGTVFDQNNTELLPATINSKIKTGDCSSTLYAIWVPNTLKVYYKANGGIVSSENYSLINDYICNTSDGSKKVQNWEYNIPEEYGLQNATTFGLSRPGYKFVGWSTSSNGTTVFDQADYDLKPTDITKTIESANCTIDLYAIWEKEITETIHTHVWNTDYTIDIEPSCTKEGSKSIHCLYCSEIKDVTVVPIVNHDYEDTIIPPTLLDSGYTEHICSVCKTSYIDDLVVPILSGALLGDTDDDENINIKDATFIQKHIAGLAQLTERGAVLADIDGNSKINILDATIIQKHCVSMSVSYPVGEPIV